MNPEHWSRVKDIFDSAVEEPEAGREAFVRAACEGEPGLEAEVLRLLRAYNESSDFLEAGAADLYDGLAPRPSSAPALAAGTILVRRFEVRTFINRGGMGEVYEAWDAQLNQSVALKIILPYIAANPAVIERFKQEVRHAREVSHPNICRVHELFCEESATGAPMWFLSMEMLRGVTLLEHLRQTRQLAPRVAIHVADGMLAGLQAAHSRGLVHRDFKSSNVMLLDSPGSPMRVVITDFGLAMTHVPDGASTRDLVARGTPGYMPPEQSRGAPVGPQADQYAFGVVLWEMMTGRTPPAVGRPSLGMRHNTYPSAWPKVIRRCTAGEPESRFRDMAAVRSALLPTPLRKRIPWAAAAMILLVAGVGWFWQSHVQPNAAACLICNTTQITPDVDTSESPSLSRDGRVVAYSSDRVEPGNLDIFVQTLPSGPIVRITHDAERETAPSISPDGKEVAFRSERDGGGIYLASVQAPDKARLLARGGRDPRFSPDGTSLLYWTGDPDSSMPSGKAFRLALADGSAQPVAPQFKDARYPVWNTDGQHVLLTGCAQARDILPDCFDWWTANADAMSFAPTGAFAALRKQNFLPGRLNSLEWRDNLMFFTATSSSSRLNLASVSLQSSSPHTLGRPSWLLTSDAGDLSPTVSANNLIAFTRTTGGAMHIWQMSGLRERRRPVPERVTADPEVDGTPFVADGGRYLVFARGRGLRRSIVQRDMASGLETVLINAGTPVQSPILDGSGTWLVYQQTEPDGISAIYAGQVHGAMRRLCSNCSEPFGWLRQGRTFFFHEGANALGLGDLATGQITRILSDSSAVFTDASWSPTTGEMIIAKTGSTLRQLAVVHLNSLTGVPDGPLYPIPEGLDSPIRPQWLADGRGIVYVSGRDGFMCLYTRRFDLVRRSFGEPVAFAHFHHERASIDEVLPRVLNLSVDRDTLFLNLGEHNSTIEVGQISGHL